MRIIRQVTFSPESIDIQYMDATDIRLEGFVFQTHNLSVARDNQYDDEIRAVEEALDDLVRDVMEDFKGSLPYDPSQIQYDGDDDDDDE